MEYQISCRFVTGIYMCKISKIYILQMSVEINNFTNKKKRRLEYDEANDITYEFYLLPCFAFPVRFIA